MHAELDTRWAEASDSEAHKFAHVVSRLQAELAECRAALTKEETRRIQAEERFRQAFMRGVSALNMEALAVLATESTTIT
jgi:predicted anti-sigma-YlaC factor YlaD